TEADIETRPEWYEQLYPLVAERLTRFDEIPEKLSYMFWDTHVELDEKSVDKILKKEGCRANEVLAAVRLILADESIAWECDPLQDACRALTETLDVKAKAIFQPIRVAVCGNMVSPPLFESIELMEREQVVGRIDATIQEVFGA
ncbi:MAG: glutamate--tRNA ligase, partial [Raoultibacter sp.]